MDKIKQALLQWIPVGLSVVAICFSGLQWRDAHQNMTRAVQPLIDFDTEDDPEDFPFGIAVENSGTGPAIIKSVSYYLDKKRIEDVEDLVAAAKLSHDQTSTLAFDKDDILGAGQKAWLIWRVKKFRVDKKEATKFADFLDDHLGIEVRFCSLADDCWPSKCSTPGRCS